MDLLVTVGTALWLGILTSISPCPLATNIAAVSYIGKQVSSPGKVFLCGFLYALGRMLVYTILGVLLVHSLLNAPVTARFLQGHLNKWLGPLLILAGFVLLQVFPKLSFRLTPGERLPKILAGSGGAGAFLLGAIFALSFCPVSAVLFFGSLMPLAITRNSEVLLPSVYGMGTALPVLVAGLVLVFGVRHVGRLFDVMKGIDRWSRPLTGVVFLLVGAYYSYRYLL